MRSVLGEVRRRGRGKGRSLLQGKYCGDWRHSAGEARHAGCWEGQRGRGPALLLWVQTGHCQVRSMTSLITYSAPTAPPSFWFPSRFSVSPLPALCSPTSGLPPAPPIWTCSASKPLWSCLHSTCSQTFSELHHAYPLLSFLPPLLTLPEIFLANLNLGCYPELSF